jgi:hypothetical protein
MTIPLLKKVPGCKYPERTSAKPDMWRRNGKDKLPSPAGLKYLT